jgi:hypothetical protein
LRGEREKEEEAEEEEVRRDRVFWLLTILFKREWPPTLNRRCLGGEFRGSTRGKETESHYV